MGTVPAKTTGPAFQAAAGSKSAPWRRWIVGASLLTFLFLSAGIGAVGYCYFLYQLAVVRKAAESELAAVADLKLQQIVEWRKARMDSAERIARDPFVGQSLEEFLAGSPEGPRRAQLLRWLSLIRESNQGLRALLLDPKMNVRLAFPEDKDYFGPIAQSSALEALHSSRIVMSDLHRSSYTGEIHLDLAIPLCADLDPAEDRSPAADRGSRPPIAVVVVEVDPQQFLYPHIQHWPTPSPSAESLLLRREGDEVLFLNDLRHKAGTALSLRLPIDNPERVGSKAALGSEGVVEGADYRGVPVLASVRSVAGTPWFLVAKVDMAEIDAPLRERGWATAGLVTIVIVLTALWLGCLGRCHDNYWLRKQLTEQKRTEEQQANMLKRLEGVNRLQEDLLLPGTLQEKFKKIADTALGLLDLDFCRIWSVGPADLCNRGCMHALPAEERDACRRRDQCLHLIMSSGRYTHADGNHRRVPFGAYKIGRVANGEERRFLTNDVTTDPQVADHAWAKGIGIVSFAGYKLDDPDGRPTGVLAAFAKHALSEEDHAFLSNLAETTSKVILDSRAEEELHEQRKRAECANRAKSEFLANMSHEIRTPMTAILGFAEILLDELREPEAVEAAQTIKRNGEHLLRLINDILDISKIEAGRMDVENARWSPRQIVAEVVSLMHVRANAKGLTLRDEYDGPLPESIVTDPARLRQILVNLVGNAIKFTNTGGVRIVTRLVPVAGGGSMLKFDVIDTGRGIPESEIARLFEPFTQADSSASRRHEGTGLGLTISRHLARALGGDVTARSELGKGSTFTATVATGPLEGVPLVREATETAEPGAQREEPAAESSPKLLCRVLLAEDIPDNQRLIASILRSIGAEVTIVENGQEAVEQALATHPGWGRRHDDAREPFNVVLMDMQMPVLDGYEATGRLRREGYARPIIALTAHSMRGDREKCIDAGCDDYLSKPVDRNELLKIVAQWAASGTMSGQDIQGVRKP